MPTMLLPDETYLDWVLEDRRERGIDDHDEVWDGVYVVMPIANNEHQIIGGRLSLAYGFVTDFDHGDRCLPGANVSDREVDWTKNYRAPDFLIYLAGNRAENRSSHWLGGPDLAVEVVSAQRPEPRQAGLLRVRRDSGIGCLGPRPLAGGGLPAAGRPAVPGGDGVQDRRVRADDDRARGVALGLSRRVHARRDRRGRAADGVGLTGGRARRINSTNRPRRFRNGVPRPRLCAPRPRMKKAAGVRAGRFRKVAIAARGPSVARGGGRRLTAQKVGSGSMVAVAGM